MNVSPTPPISVIVPTYNRLPLLRQSVESLRQQTYPAESYEVIVVDDGSTDGTVAYLEEVADGVKLRVVRQTNRGPAAARNTGVQAAQYEWLAFTDDDCQASPDWLTVLARRLAPHQAIGGLVLPANSNNWLHRFFLTNGRTHPQQSAGVVDTLFSCNMIVHRSDLSAAGGFDAAFAHPGGEDLDLSYRLLRQGVSLICESDALLYHEYPTRLLAFTRHFWNHGQGMAFVFGKWPHKAPPGPASWGHRRLELWFGGSPLFPLLLAFWQLLMCLGHILLALTQTWRPPKQAAILSAGEAVGNVLLTIYVLIVEQAGLVVGTYRWGGGQRRQSSEGG